MTPTRATTTRRLLVAALALVASSAACRYDWDAGECAHPPVEERCSAGWCLVPAGCFRMGSPADEPCRETGPGCGKETTRFVTLTHAFVIQHYEVDQEDFLEQRGYNPSALQGFLDPDGETYCGSDNCGKNPVENVNWHEAAAYCNDLTAAEEERCYECTDVKGPNVRCSLKSASIYSCRGVRLPTEAEWEYAYRAGTRSAYYSGPNAPDQCMGKDENADGIGWYRGNAEPSNDAENQPLTYPGGLKSANGWGLHDMAGNVLEWCHDWYQEDLGSEPVVDPMTPINSDGNRVVRGGSWNDLGYPRNLRAAYRNKKNSAYNRLGFRCAQTSFPE